MFYYTTVITFLMASMCVCVSLHGQVDPPQGCNRIKANLCVCVCVSEIIIYSRGFDVCVYERKEVVCVCVCVSTVTQCKLILIQLLVLYTSHKTGLIVGSRLTF